ncbi:ArnT family glycosyltransferase [Polymorphobacter arshaanensis]|uniref:ArnT family glycosyltransferase n=1 Tax=Glacieibacterium arshaanense TaxID=2511025 RepID=UPI00140B0037|nr:glycosyltransferase family 39 protein [Polymorphobacter arshaanensis]
MAIALLAAMLIAINPVGYIGGHWDDGRYLATAQLWATHGPQLGHDHWALRATVVGPAAIAIKLFGDTRPALMLPGLLLLVALLAVQFAAAWRAFGLAVASIATLALVTTPAILFAATRLTADLTETLFWALALWSYWFAGTATRHQRLWLLATGLATGLAFATRETAVGLCLVLALGWVKGWRSDRLPRRVYGWIALGFAAVALPELISFALASGDAFYRVRVDLAHVKIASTNLDGLTFAGHQVLLNPELMSRWHGAGPIRLHWAIDPWLNLFANPGYGLGFAATALAVLAAFRRAPSAPLRALCGPLVAVIVIQVAVVLYVIATDPKPRMFMPSLLPAALLFALAAQSLGTNRAGRALVAALLASKLILTFIAVDFAPAQPDVAAQAATALALADGPVHVSRWTRSQLALAPASVTDRLTTAPPLADTLALTIERPGDDDDGVHAATDTLLWRSPPGRAPLSVRAMQVLGVPVTATIALSSQRRTPTVNLYRRGAN